MGIGFELAVGGCDIAAGYIYPLALALERSRSRSTLNAHCDAPRTNRAFYRFLSVFMCVYSNALCVAWCWCYLSPHTLHMGYPMTALSA